MGYKKRVTTNKEIKEDLTTPSPKTEKQRRYVHYEKVEQRKAEGWEVVKEKADKHNRTLGVNTNISDGSKENTADLVSMEK